VSQLHGNRFTIHSSLVNYAYQTDATSAATIE